MYPCECCCRFKLPRPCRALADLQRSRACRATPESPESHESHSTQLHTSFQSDLTVIFTASDLLRCNCQLFDSVATFGVLLQTRPVTVFGIESSRAYSLHFLAQHADDHVRLHVAGRSTRCVNNTSWSWGELTAIIGKLAECPIPTLRGC
jgi:hypothetical protein